jgi:hypothetical protein
MRTKLGTTFTQVLRRYAEALVNVGGPLVIVPANQRAQEQLLLANGAADVIGTGSVCSGNDRGRRNAKRACADGAAWTAEQRRRGPADACSGGARP